MVPSLFALKITKSFWYRSDQSSSLINWKHFVSLARERMCARVWESSEGAQRERVDPCRWEGCKDFFFHNRQTHMIRL